MYIYILIIFLLCIGLNETFCPLKIIFSIVITISPLSQKVLFSVATNILSYVNKDIKGY